MRIIAGIARGRTIFAPKGQHTRPTLDFVRESLFSIIRLRLPGAVVLDLFAGSGALALEALSRGAERAVLADKSRQAIDCIRRNVQSLGFTEQATILQADWRAVPGRISQAGFNLVFLDPPYMLTQYGEITQLLAASGLLVQGALIVIEHRKDAQIALSASFHVTDRRTYGDTGITMATFDTGGKMDGN